ncbi:MAG: hypothetical protein AAFU78_17085 [Cyanobacteria bacterium J06633_2]
MPSLQTRLSFSSEQIAQFHKQGYLILENLLSLSQVEQLLERFDPFQTEY